MVRIVAGIDFENYPFALSLLERLRFASAEVRLMHVIESVMPDQSFPELDSAHPLSVLMAEHEQQGKAELTKAVEMIGSGGYSVSTGISRGNPARCLIEYAKESSADIIAVGSAQKGAWASLFFGSVTKALTASAEQSILVAKSHPRSKDGIRAVFAVDHSDYCNRCVDRFIEWNAHGVWHVTVVNAPEHANLLGHHAIDGGQLLKPEIETRMDELNANVCEKLQHAGIECDYRLVHDHPNQAIEATMEATDSDLLILGARGHGFWDRIRLGSVSHHQVVATPHNVLVVRI